VQESERYHHHPMLALVAQEDVRFLLERDRQYGASWKEAGGRSAWFMLRRKMDRLIQMMRQPDPPAELETKLRELGIGLMMGASSATIEKPDLPTLGHLLKCYFAENVFAMIRDEPDGEDGTVLAEVRDLRRYLMLVEAEMMARGVVEKPAREEKLYERPVTARTPLRIEDGLCSPDECVSGIPYIQVTDPLEGRIYHLVDRTKVDVNNIDCDHLQKLSRELNHAEWSGLPGEYRGLYAPFDEGDNKYKMLQEYCYHWARW
jgi:hypothetical protein